MIQGVRPLWIAAQIQQIGIRVQAAITAQRTGTSLGNGQANVYYLRYQFTTTSGQFSEVEQIVSRTTAARLQVGDSIPVKYLAYDPGLSALTDNLQDDVLSSGNIIVALTGCIGLCTVLGLIAYFGWQLWWENQYFTRGHLVMGHILSCHAELESVPKSLNVQVHGPGLGGRYMIDLSYSFRSPNGQTIRAKVERQRNDLRANHLPTFGQRIAVLYLNDKHYKIL